MHFNESILDSHSDSMRVIRCLGEGETLEGGGSKWSVAQTWSCCN